MQQLLIDVTGKPFPDLVADLVLKPFGMIRSGFFSAAPERRRAIGCNALPGGRHAGARRRSHLSRTRRRGIVDDAEQDLARFALAVRDAWAGRNTSVLSQATAVQMLTPGLGDYGLGLIVRWFPSQIGDFSTMASMVRYLRTRWSHSKTAMARVVMTNGARGTDLVFELMHSIAVEYGWPAGQTQDFGNQPRSTLTCSTDWSGLINSRPIS